MKYQKFIDKFQQIDQNIDSLREKINLLHKEQRDFFLERVFSLFTMLKEKQLLTFVISGK